MKCDSRNGESGVGGGVKVVRVGRERVGNVRVGSKRVRSGSGE